jgi:integrase
MTYVEAIMKVAAMQQLLALGLDPQLGVMLLRTWFFQHYLPDIQKTNRSWKSSLQRFLTHVDPVIGHLRLCDINHFHLVRLVNGLQPSTKGRRKLLTLADASVNRVIALLQGMFSRLAATGVLQQNPAKLLKMRRERNIRARVLLPHEFEPFFSALAKAPLQFQLLIFLLILTGMRISEALSARWNFVDFDRCYIRLPDTKSGRPRVIPLSPAAVAVLNRLLLLRSNEYLFAGSRGGHLSRPTRPFNRLLAESGVRGLWLHDLRRVFGSTAALTHPTHAVSKLLGHSNPMVTARYLVATDADLHSAVAGVGARFEAYLPEMRIQSDVTDAA